MRQLIDRIERQEQMLDAMEHEEDQVDLSKLSDEELRILQLEEIRSRPESTWTAYDRFIIAEHGAVS